MLMQKILFILYQNCLDQLCQTECMKQNLLNYSDYNRIWIASWSYLIKVQFVQLWAVKKHFIFVWVKVIEAKDCRWRFKVKQRKCPPTVTGTISQWTVIGLYTGMYRPKVGQTGYIQPTDFSKIHINYSKSGYGTRQCSIGCRGPLI